MDHNLIQYLITSSVMLLFVLLKSLTFEAVNRRCEERLLRLISRWLVNKLKFMLKPNYYILMSVEQLGYFILAIRFHSLAFGYVANIAINEIYVFRSHEMNFPLSQFHVLWIFIIHLCSTISHLSTRAEHGRWGSIDSKFDSTPSAPLASKANVSHSYSEIQSNAICRNMFHFFCSLHWISMETFQLKYSSTTLAVGVQNRNRVHSDVECDFMLKPIKWTNCHKTEKDCVLLKATFEDVWGEEFHASF